MKSKLLTFEIENRYGELIEYEMYVDITTKELIKYYGEEVEEEVYEDDEDFFEWLKERHQDEAIGEYWEEVEESIAFENMMNRSHYW